MFTSIAFCIMTLYIRLNVRVGILLFNCLTVYSKIHSAAANCVTGAIHAYIFTKHGIEMRGTNK